MSTNGRNSLKDIFFKVIDEYASVYSYVRENNDWKNPFRELISNSIPTLLRSTAGIEPPYIVEGSYGKGRWTGVPWIAVFDSRITTSAQKGVYIVYLLNKDTKELFLTFEVAATEVRGERTDSDGRVVFTGVVNNYDQDAKNRLQTKVQEIRDAVPDNYFASDNAIQSGSEGYNAGAVYYKKYTLDDMPSEKALIDDLKRMMDIYGRYYSWTISGSTEEHPIGHFDSWEIVDNHTAIKTCDKSFFTYTGSGIPKEICWFFETEKMASGQTKQIVLNYKGVSYDGKVANDTTDRRRFRIFWSSDLGKIFRQYQSIPGQRLLFAKSGEEYNIEFVGGEPEMQLSVKASIDVIKTYIAAKGFTYEPGLIENFYLSLKTKPFVILAGTSGTGKSRLVRLFAEAVGATVENGRFKMVAVRPDWSDSSDLFGHVDLNGRFIPGTIIDFVKQAESDLVYPYFLCLDEMNLARVEYYMSDFLSIIETRNMQDDGSIVSDPLVYETYYGADTTASKRYGTIRLSENLYIIGTVNMDETTFPFSRKVLDRANTIEFSYVDLMPDFELLAQKKADALQVKNAFLKTDYLLLNQCNEDEEAIGDYCAELQQINRVLQSSSSHVGYRVRDEIVFYLVNNKKYGLLPENAAMDNEIMQKILPRIQGSSSSVKTMLCELFKICAGDFEGYQTASDDLYSKMAKAVKAGNCRYVRSAEKITYMIRRFEEDGFTSYWL